MPADKPPLPQHHHGGLYNSLESQLALTETPTRVLRKLSERDDWKLMKNKIGNFNCTQNEMSHSCKLHKVVQQINKFTTLHAT